MGFQTQQSKPLVGRNSLNSTAFPRIRYLIDYTVSIIMRA